MEREGQETKAKAKAAPAKATAEGAAVTGTARGRGQIIRGRVVSDKMAKTRVLELPRSKTHRLYHKSMTRRTKLFYHDEKNESQTGDTVLIVSTRPISRLKNFRLLKVVAKRVEQ